MRLTNKNSLGSYFTNIRPIDSGLEKDLTIYGEVPIKLGQLEDIDEKLGIELIIIGKALLQGDIYVKEVGFVKFHIAGDSICYIGNYLEVVYLNLRDYGKTWALTKKELENGKEEN